MADAPGIQVLLAPDSALPEIRHGGRTWTVGRPDQAAKARLEKLVKKVAIDEVRALKDVLDSAAYREAFSAVTANLKQYDTWREGWQSVVGDPGNAHLFLWSLLCAKHPEVTEDEVKELMTAAPEEVEAALLQVMPDFFQLLLSAGLAKLPAGPVREEVESRARVVLATVLERQTPTPASSST